MVDGKEYKKVNLRWTNHLEDKQYKGGTNRERYNKTEK